MPYRFFEGKPEEESGLSTNPWVSSRQTNREKLLAVKGKFQSPSQSGVGWREGSTGQGRQESRASAGPEGQETPWHPGPRSKEGTEFPASELGSGPPGPETAGWGRQRSRKQVPGLRLYQVQQQVLPRGPSVRGP